MLSMHFKCLSLLFEAQFNVIFVSTHNRLGSHYNYLFGLQIEANGYHTKTMPFTIHEFKKEYPKLLFLEVILQNSSIYTTTTEKTTSDVPTTTVSKMTKFSSQFASSSESSNDIKRNNEDFNVTMLMSTEIGGACTMTESAVKFPIIFISILLWV